MFSPYLKRWGLVPDGKPIKTHSSDLLPVRFQGRPAMLKLAHPAEEVVGHRLMVWYGGDGAAQVYAHDDHALLLERLTGEDTLAQMAENGQDEEATQILCRAVARLHEHRSQPWPELPTLRRWFRALEQFSVQGGMFLVAWNTAQKLLAQPQDRRPLHGDIHHRNILHSPERGWLAIDPKGILGERGYDYANIFCNPTLALATQPGRLVRQAYLVSQEANLSYSRLLQWILAYAGLSAAWHLEDSDTKQAEAVLQIAEVARGAMGCER